MSEGVTTTDTRWLDAAELSAWRNLSLMQFQLTGLLGRELAAAGLSYADYTVLAGLSDSEGRARLNEMGRMLGWEKSRLSHQITRMEKRGLVAKERCPSDGRGWFVVVTDEGRRAIEAAAPAHVASVRRHFVDLLTPEQVRVLDDVASTVLDHLESLDD